MTEKLPSPRKSILHNIGQGVFWGILSMSIACSDMGPTAATNIDQDAGHTLRRTYYLSGFGLSDGITEFHVDTAAGEIKITDAGGGNAIYLQYDDELLQDIIETVQGVHVGDLNYDAMASLSPWENSGGDPQRPSGPPQWGDDNSAKKKSQLDKVLTRPVGSTKSTEVPASSFFSRSGGDRFSRFVAPSMALMDDEWSPQCPSIAQAIGYQRLAHYSNRSTLFSELRGVQGIPATRIQWTDGKPFVTLQDIRTLYITLGVSLADAWAGSIQLNVMRTMYNGHNCQQPIVIQPPTPGAVHLPPSSGGGNAGWSCSFQNELWEASFDGGLTWYPYTVQKYVCVFAT